MSLRNTTNGGWRAIRGSVATISIFAFLFIGSRGALAAHMNASDDNPVSTTSIERATYRGMLPAETPD